MTIYDADELIQKYNNLFYTSFLLRFMEECGAWMNISGYKDSILRESRWYILEKQLEELCAIRDLIDNLEVEG